MALAAGTKLGHYDVTALLGEGGMGQVWQATDTQLGREVALKILPDAFAADPDRLARFKREARILARLNHPNIAAIYGIEESERTRALVLELVEGPTLADRIAKGPIPVDEALPIAKQIAEALEAAHEAGVIHRDLKPANIKVREDGTVKVLDFGLAKALAGEQPDQDLSQAPTMTATMGGTRAGVILGTAAYMSPEQARGKPLDKRTDIWSFGCVLFEMVTGRAVFGGDTLSDTIANVLDRQPQWEWLPVGTPSSTHRLLRRCLAKDRRRRLHDIADARIEMDDGEDGADATGPSASHTAPLWQRLIPWVSVGAVVVIALVAFSSERASAPEVTRLTVVLPAGAFFNIINDSGVAVSPDGRTVVFSAVDDGRRLYRHDLNALETVPILGTEGARLPFFSPNGQWVAFFVNSRTEGPEVALKKIPVTGGRAVTVVPVRRQLAGNSAWSGGTWLGDDSIVFGSDAALVPPGGPGLFRVSASGGEVSAVAAYSENGEEVFHRGPAALPDGRGFISIGWTEDSPWVYLHRPDAGDPVPLVRGSFARVSPTGHLVFEQDGAVWAVALDTEQGTVTGEPVLVLDSFLSMRNNSSPIFDLSATGTLAYAEPTYPDRSLVWVNTDGQEEPLGFAPQPYWWPHVSPDGDQIGVHIMEAENMDFHIYDLTSGAILRFTRDPANDGFPLWTPDGKRVVFWSARGGPWNLYTRPADRTGQAERLTQSPNLQIPHSFGNDGSTLVFTEASPDNSGTDIWKMSIDGDRTPEPVLQGPYNEDQPALSPDGRWIAYQSDESGTWQIVVRPFPDVESDLFPVGAGGVSPEWSPDSQWLYYRGETAMMAVQIDTTGGFSAAPPVALFEDRYVGGSEDTVGIPGQAYAVAPDGRFLMMKDPPQRGRAAQLIVVRNWHLEFTERVPVN